MSSILTNTSAMVALQTLNGINKNLAMTQNEISTGKSISSARDNSAIWAISTVMESDVSGFKAISESLSLGSSTVAVARDASEQITTLLNEVKSKIVAAQEDNVDREKLQADLSSLRDQIGGIVSAAQFNGQNLLSNTSTTAGDGTMSVLASLDRDASGNVSASQIDIVKQDLGQGDNTAGTMADSVGSGVAVAVAGATGAVATFTSTTIVAGQSFEFNMGGTLDAAADLDFTGTTVSYVAREGDTMSDVVDNMVARLNYETAAAGSQELITFSASTTAGEINVTNNSIAAINVAAGDVEEDTDGASADGTVGGGLELLGDIDISTEDGAAAALAAIEGLTQNAIDGAAEFGTGEKRLEIQNDFMGKLTDSLRAGIGALVDADMEEASARLQALQVQQQLGIQSLSIANQSPQNILSLFR